MSGVSRETPPTPPAASGVFSRRLSLAEAYAELLVGAGVDRGLIGPREAPRIWERHLLNCAVVQELVPRAARVADVGSGAGLPGLALAIARPDLTVALIEPLQRRCDFLREAVDTLGLGAQVTVVRSRVEDLGAVTYDQVTARAVAPVAKLAQWCLPVTRPGGDVLAIKGSSARDEVDTARPVLAQLGVDSISVETVGVGLLDHPTTVVRLHKAGG